MSPTSVAFYPDQKDVNSFLAFEVKILLLKLRN